MKNITSCAAVGAPIMMGKTNGCLKLMKDHPNMLLAYCVINRKNLVAKNISPVLNEILNLVIKSNNAIKANVNVSSSYFVRNEMKTIHEPSRCHGTSEKLHVPPINIDNGKNQAALLQHLQNITKQKLEAKLIGTKFRIYPKTPYAYHQIRRYIEENSLESHTYMLPEDKLLRAVIRGLPIDMSPTQIIADLEKPKDFTSKNATTCRARKPANLCPSSCSPWKETRNTKKSSSRSRASDTCVKCAKNHLAKDCKKPIDEKPKCCLCEGEHPANYLDCPKNPRHRIAEEKEKKKLGNKPAYITPEPPKVNFWEQRAKTAAQRQQSTSTNQQKQAKPPTDSTSPSKQSNNPETISDIFDELKNPAVQETFELLEEFIRIATTIPTRFGRLRAINQLYIINLQETHLQPCHHLAFPNYNIYRTDRTCRGGGTAILIKRNIPHHEIIINNQSFETTAIKIERTNLQPITVISAYRSPRKPILVHDLHQLFRNQDYVLVAGDLNAKHASWSPIAQQNVAGHTIRRFCDSTGYSLNAPLEPTHFHKNLRNTVIDLAICKGMTITDVTSIPELSSDHNPVLFEVCLDNFTAPALSTYAFPNWKKFQDILTNTLPGNPIINNTNDIETAISNFNFSLKNAYNNGSTFKSINKPLKTIPSVIRDKNKLKNRIRKEWQATKYPPYKSQLNKLQKEIKKELQNYNNTLNGINF
ncbi:RNA-directed DNA polymerase from mobile element jockey [Trichonephila clavipes]|nr:RNA-directed DNA polymerase from mobile element jockey [Trichonephila clavipes]